MLTSHWTPTADRRAAPALGAALRRGLARARATLALWHRRAKQRRQLAHWAAAYGYGFVDGTGIASGEAFAEANKPLWKA
jgi:hypothetical protein